MNHLDLSALQNAIAQLEKALGYARSQLATSDPDLFEQFRNSTIQCFEYTYELSWKFMKRQIEMDHPNPAVVDEWGFKDLIREAAVRGLIEDPAAWFSFRQLRYISSHAYGKAKAEEVYEGAPILLGAA